MASLSIRNVTRRRVPAVSRFRAVAREVLPGWELSLAFVGAAKAKRLNKALRAKTYVPNVLSYRLGAKSGEILICLDRLAVEAPLYRLSSIDFCLLLFIHALLHLKGRRHGTTMEHYERAVLARFIRVPSPRTHGSKNRNRYRRRHKGDQGRRRRGSKGP